MILVGLSIPRAFRHQFRFVRGFPGRLGNDSGSVGAFPEHVGNNPASFERSQSIEVTFLVRPSVPTAGSCPLGSAQSEIRPPPGSGKPAGSSPRFAALAGVSRAFNRERVLAARVAARLGLSTS